MGRGVFSQPQQQLLCPLSTLRHGHQREEAVFPRGEGLREQPNFPRKDTAKSRDIAGVLLANWVRGWEGGWLVGWLKGRGWSVSMGGGERRVKGCRVGGYGLC